MKLTLQEIAQGKWNHDATVSWAQHTVPAASNKALELDAYGVYVAEALDADIFIKEVVSAATAATVDLDGYGLLVRQGMPATIFVGQLGYDGADGYDAMHLAARAVDIPAKLRLLKVGQRRP